MNLSSNALTNEYLDAIIHHRVRVVIASPRNAERYLPRFAAYLNTHCHRAGGRFDNVIYTCPP